MTPRILELRQGLLRKNDQEAAVLRERFRAAGVFVVNLVSGPGAGKTRLLEWTLRALTQRGHQPAALVGDCETDRDAQRLAASGAPARQVVTHGVCHLEAAMVARHLDPWRLDDLDFLFIENVGNLVCTTAYDLGEALRVVCLSVTEGEDKPLKYPALFHSADALLVTKIDLADPCEFNRDEAARSLRSVRPGVPLLETSAKTGEGMDDWLALLEERRALK